MQGVQTLNSCRLHFIVVLISYFVVIASLDMCNDVSVNVSNYLRGDYSMTEVSLPSSEQSTGKAALGRALAAGSAISQQNMVTGRVVASLYAKTVSVSLSRPLKRKLILFLLKTNKCLPHFYFLFWDVNFFSVNIEN